MYFLFNWFVKITGFLPYMILLRPKVSFEDKKVQGRHINGGCIVVSNHISLFDFGVTLFTFPTRTLRCAVAELMYRKNFFMSTFLKLTGTIKVDRDSHDFSFISACSKILSRGGVVEIYPESRLPQPDEERPLEFKPSAVYLALTTGAPIIPICNNGRYLSKERMRVFVGTPIDAREMYRDELSEKENVAHITAYIRSKIIEYQKQLEQQEKEG